MKTTRKVAALCAAAVALSLAFAGCKEKDGGSAAGAKGGKGAKAKDGVTMVKVAGGSYTPSLTFLKKYEKGFLDDKATYKSIGTPKSVTLADFEIGTTEITYKTWYDVKQWAVDEARGDSRYRFITKEKEGSQGKESAEPTANSNHPVTHITMYQAVLWCNALSEKQGLEPVYYLDGKVLRDEKKLEALGYGEISGPYDQKGVTAYNYFCEKAGKDASKNYDDENTPTFDDILQVCSDEVSAFALLKELYPESNDFAMKVVEDKSKNGYRLPSWYEWEFAARGGKPDGYDWDMKFSGSDEGIAVGYFREECGWDKELQTMNEYYDNYGTKPVAQKKANALGLYDMSGNVQEWTSTPIVRFEIKQTSSAYKGALGISITYRVSTGNWYSKPLGITDTSDGNQANGWGTSTGFRVARNAQ